MADDAGIGDPYWYEWFVGLRRAIELLDPDSDLTAVVFQASGVKGIDDVVVRSASGATHYIQVKHTRDNNTLTFGDLVRTPSPSDGRKSTPPSLLKKTAAGWKAQREKEGKAIAVTFATNRELGQRPYEDNPRLDEFWSWLKAEATAKPALADIEAPEAYRAGFAAFCGELADLDDGEAAEFVRTLEIDAEWPSLGDLEAECVARLSVLLGVPDDAAAHLFTILAGSLRHWTVSTRDREDVTAETIWAALTESTETIGDHDLAPPAPFLPSRSGFLDELRTAVLAPDARAIWLVGEPGSGKTSIISACTNAVAPLVDIRFHAYRPITPDTRVLPADGGRLVEAEALWGDLLSQLRTRFFRGKLAQHRVPVRNAFLSADGLRREVLRLAEAVADETGRPFVIAIDGLDHAARAGGRGRPLLDSLPPPDSLPKSIRLLLGGQPHYEEYPVWLKDSAVQVPVPSVSVDDVATLLDARLEEPGFAALSGAVEVAARAVAEVARGNCLTAVFAVEELSGVATAADAPARLARRRLGPQLGGYYDQLWRAASGPLERRSLGAGLDLAAALCIAPERLTGELVHSMFKERGVTVHEWEAALRQLRPLVVEEEGGWRLLVNDVRVFLHGRLRDEPDTFRRAASALADVLDERSDKDLGTYAALPVLLDQADRGHERVERFTSEWVLGAYRAGLSPREIERQADDAVGLAGEAEWSHLFELARGLFTLEQLFKSLQWIGREDEPAATARVPTCTATEGRVPPTGTMQASDLLRFGEDAVLLIEADEDQRALALANRWLAEADLEALCSPLGDHEGHSDDADTLKAAAEAIGNVAAATRTAFIPLPSKETGRGLAHFHAYLARGALRRAARDCQAETWAFVLDELVSSFFPDDLVAPVAAAVATDRVSSLQPLLDWHANSSGSRTMPPLVELWLHLAHAVEGVPAAVLGSYVAAGVEDLQKRESEPPYARVMEAWALLAFLKGYLRREAEPGTVADEIHTAFAAKYDRGGERRARTGTILRAAVVCGGWCARVQAGERTRPDDVALPTRLGRMLTTLLAVPTRTYEVDYGAPEAAAVVFGLIARVAQADQVDRSAWNAVVTSAVTYCTGEYVGPVRDSILWVLRAANRQDAIKLWRGNWCAEPDGRLWRGGQDDSRSEIIEFFIEATHGLDDADIEIPSMLDRDRRTRIGFSGRKEGVLDVPQTWFETLAQRDPSLWDVLGLRLLQISETVSRNGENSLSGVVEAAVYQTAAAHGRREVLRLAESRRLHADGQQLPRGEVIEFLLAAASDGAAPLDKDEIEAVWAATTGLFSWTVRDDRHFIARMRAQLQTAAGRAEVPFEPLRDEVCWQCAAAEPDPETSGSRLVLDDENGRPEPPADLDELEARWPREPRSSKPWKDFRRILTASLSGDDRSEISRFFDLLMTRDFSLGFRYDGSTDSAVQMLPLLDEHQLRTLLRRSLESKYDRADCLLLVLAGRSITEPAAGAAQLNALLDDMAAWVEMHGLRSVAEPTSLVAVESAHTTLTSWAVAELVAALDSYSADEFGAALRGLGRILLNQRARAELAGVLEQRDSAPSDQAVLFVLEALVRRQPEAWPEVRSVAERARSAKSLQGRLQGWLVERAASRLLDAEEPSFAGAPDVNSDIAVLDAAPILTKPTQHGHVLTASVEQSARSSLTRVQRATGRNLLGAEERAAHERERAEGTVSLRPPRLPRGGSCYRLDPVGAAAVGNVVAQEMCAGGALDGVPPVRLAQALLSGDDPWLATSSSKPMSAAMKEEWPDEDWFRSRRDIAPAARSAELQALLGRLLLEGVEADWVVLGGVAKAFGDVDVLLWHHLAADEDAFPDLWRTAWEVPRSFGWSTPDAWSTCRAPSATCRSHGGFDYVDGCFDLAPAVAHWQAAGWSVSNGDPTRWLKGGDVVARFERFARPRDYDYDGSHRYPSLRRWVAPQAAADELAELLGLHLVPRMLLETFKPPPR